MFKDFGCDCTRIPNEAGFLAHGSASCETRQEHFNAWEAISGKLFRILFKPSL